MCAKRIAGNGSILMVLITCMGCGGGFGTVNLAPEAREVDAPEWFLSPPIDPDRLFAAATMTSRDMPLAVQKAEALARAELAQQMDTRLGSLIKRFQEEAGLSDDSKLLQELTSATKLVTRQALTGSRTEKKQLLDDRGIYRAYVLMSVPIGTANHQLMEKIRANRDLYTRFRAVEAFKELEEELEAFEEGQ